MLKLLRPAALLILIGLLASACTAQDGLTEDEATLIARIIAAEEKTTTYDNFIININGTFESLITFYSEDRADKDTVNLATSFENTIRAHRGENPSGHMTSYVTSEGDENYRASGELIYVDGRLYGRGEVETGDLSFPADFVLIRDETETMVYRNTDFYIIDWVLFMQFLQGEYVNDQGLLEAVTLEPEFITSITLEETEYNSQNVDIISYHLDVEDYMALIEALAELDEVNNEDLEQINTLTTFLDTQKINLISNFALDADDNLIYQEFEVVMTVENRESSFQEGITSDASLRVAFRLEYLEINPSLDPIEAPQIGQ